MEEAGEGSGVELGRHKEEKKGEIEEDRSGDEIGSIAGWEERVILVKGEGGGEGVSLLNVVYGRGEHGEGAGGARWENDRGRGGYERKREGVGVGEY